MTREEAIDELSVIWERLSHPEECENGCYSFRDGDYLEALDMAIEALQAEAEQGEWKHTITGQPYCSNCEYVFGEDEEYSPSWKYCPMCGAIMKGGAE